MQKNAKKKKNNAKQQKIFRTAFGCASFPKLAEMLNAKETFPDIYFFRSTLV